MAAKAIAEAFSKKHPEIKTEVVDTFYFAFEIFKQILPKTFDFVTAKTPVLYKWIYGYLNSGSRRKLLTGTTNAIVKNSKFVRFIKDFNPDFIVSTNPLPMQLVSFTKQKNIVDILSANVCTDFGFHAFWHNEDVNYYFVATENIKQQLAESGIGAENIVVSGIPISPKFSEVKERSRILSELGFSTKHPVFLIVGGGGTIKYSDIVKIVETIRRKSRNTQFIIVAGRDRTLKKELDDPELKKNQKIKVFGFTERLADFMSASDAIFTKAGGLTIAECLAKGLPVIVSNVIPGQEDDNVKYLTENCIGFKADSAESVGKIAVSLFSNPEELSKIRKKCKIFSKPGAAEDIADFIASKI